MAGGGRVSLCLGLLFLWRCFLFLWRCFLFLWRCFLFLLWCFDARSRGAGFFFTRLPTAVGNSTLPGDAGCSYDAIPPHSATTASYPSKVHVSCRPYPSDERARASTVAIVFLAPDVRVYVCASTRGPSFAHTHTERESAREKKGLGFRV